ncbi:hypothetical protein H5410_018738 [Solanum commersonii]|uniref:Uncharacterized protein n=1 Tax=Solanum commersonii TaxID=4109 RepID=A0A9J6A3K8_SOLCO|nr:hypothetical protein H5410_018738 [Solanum commersonii]
MGNRGQLLVIGLLTIAIFLVKPSSSSQIVRRFSYNIERKNVRCLLSYEKIANSEWQVSRTNHFRS